MLFVEVNPVTLEHAGVTVEELYDELARSGYQPAETIRDHESVVNVVFARDASMQGRPT